MSQHWGECALENPRFLYGSNTLLVTDAVRAVGGYDPELATNNEDRTLSEALYAQGQRLLYAPAARARHLRRDTVRSVLQGYWRWHRPRGLKRGDFNSPQGLVFRIERVAFGIFRHRYDMDRTAGHHELLPLDLLLPWIFCDEDLRFAAVRFGCGAPELPWPDLEGKLEKQIAPMPPAAASGPPAEWHEEYLAEFQACLDRSGWRRDARFLANGK